MTDPKDDELDFRALFEAVPGRFLVLRPDAPRYTIVSVSDAYLQVTATTRDQISGRDLFDVFPDNPADPNATGERNLRASLDRVRQTRKPDRMAIQRYDVRDADGSFQERHWRPVNSPVLDSRGALRYIIHSVDDVTELARLRELGVEGEQRLRLLVESIRDYAIFMLHTDGTVATWNAGAERIKQYRAAEIIGKHFSIFYPPEVVASGKCELELEVAGRTGRFEDEGWRVRKDGSRFWANVVISAVRDERQKLIGFAKVTRDLTDRRNAEESRLKLAQEQAARASAEASERRFRFLANASAALGASLDYHATLQNVAQLAVPEIADWCTISTIDEHGQLRRIVVEHKDPARRQLAEDYRRNFPPGEHRAGQLGDVLKQGKAVLMASVDDAELVKAAQSEEHLRVLRGLGCTSCVMVPMVIRGEALGILSLMIGGGERRFAAADLSIAEELASRAAIAIDNARLYRQAQQRQSILAFYAEASAILGSSLDYETTLQSLARLVVPRFADWCSVEILENDEIRSVAVAHVDPARIELARELQRRYPTDPNSPTGTPNILRTGKSELYEDIPDQLLVEAARRSGYDDEYLRIVRELGLRSALSVPLVARGTTIGALSLSWAESGRRYGQEDVTVMEELGRRAGMAVDNARLYRESQSAIRLRDEFLSIAGHELRTPLAALQLQVSSLVRAAERGTLVHDAERLKQRLIKTESQSLRLDRLIGELLDVSRITAGRLTLQTHELALDRLVADVLERFGDDFKRVGVQVTAKLARVVIDGDAARLDQVVTNLLGNALKYGQGKPIAVTLEPTLTGGARLTVTDHGIGIDPQHQERIFERFERAVSERNFGGFGLGLWIANEIIVAHGGTISVASAVGEGATFTVELPARPSTST